MRFMWGSQFWLQPAFSRLLKFLHLMTVRVNSGAGASAASHRALDQEPPEKAAAAMIGCPTNHFHIPNMRATTRGRNKIRGGADNETTR